jgi:hypothetical protein
VPSFNGLLELLLSCQENDFVTLTWKFKQQERS